MGNGDAAKMQKRNLEVRACQRRCSDTLGGSLWFWTRRQRQLAWPFLKPSDSFARQDKHQKSHPGQTAATVVRDLSVRLFYLYHHIDIMPWSSESPGRQMRAIHPAEA